LNQLKHSNLDSHDWDARASDALVEAKKLPPGLDRSKAMKKASQLRVAADMKKLLTAKEPTKLTGFIKVPKPEQY